MVNVICMMYFPATPSAPDICPGRVVMECQSPNHGYKECSAFGAFIILSVTLVQQLSSASCDVSGAWGYSDTLVWTDLGCGADFEICYSEGKGC